MTDNTTHAPFPNYGINMPHPLITSPTFVGVCIFAPWDDWQGGKILHPVFVSNQCTWIWHRRAKVQTNVTNCNTCQIRINAFSNEEMNAPVLQKGHSQCCRSQYCTFFKILFKQFTSSVNSCMQTKFIYSLLCLFLFLGVCRSLPINLYLLAPVCLPRIDLLRQIVWSALKFGIACTKANPRWSNGLQNTKSLFEWIGKIHMCFIHSSWRMIVANSVSTREHLRECRSSAKSLQTNLADDLLQCQTKTGFPCGIFCFQTIPWTFNWLHTTAVQHSFDIITRSNHVFQK